MVDIAELVADVAEQPPCGPDLEYDPAFHELELAALGKPEQQFGSTLIPAEAPAWEEVRDAAVSLLKRSKDLRVATLLTRALLHSEGFPGLLEGLQLILQLLQRFWEDVYPRLDAEEDNDPTMRLNALAPLVDAEALLRDLRDAWLVRSRQHGQVLVRDVEVALGKLPPRRNAEVPSQRQIDSILAAVAAEDPTPLALVDQTRATAKELADFLNDKVGAGRAPDFKPLLTILALLAHAVQGALGEATPVAAAPGGDSEVNPASAVEMPMSTGIRTREDALRMIDQVVDYFERNEPTNPAPLLIKRARRLVSMSFIDIVKEMAPDGLRQIETIAGPGQES
ncbi:type VI secretion system protein TssA [Rhodocyclus purpureus]|uniref:type VI secretion system protein TssA n=1 Tax=Rhodocyclus purpureus TaxID=1067 RepID=UPI0019141037